MIQNDRWEEIAGWMANADDRTVECLKVIDEVANAFLVDLEIPSSTYIHSFYTNCGGLIIGQRRLRVYGFSKRKFGNPIITEVMAGLESRSTFLMIADTVFGSFFGIKIDGTSKLNIGEVFSLDPDQINWQPLGVEFIEFLSWALTGDFWEVYPEFKAIPEGEYNKLDAIGCAFNYFPPLFSVEGSVERSDRKLVNKTELFSFRKDASPFRN